ALDYLPDRVSGPIGANLTYTAFDAGRAEADVRLDLRAATLSVAEAGWSKAADMPGSGRLVLDLTHEQITRLRDIEVKASGLHGKFALGLTPDRQNIQRIDVERLVVGENDVAGHISRRAEGGWRVELHGPTLDLTHWLNESSNDSLSRHSATDPLLRKDARLGRLILGPHRQLHDLSVQLIREGDIWQNARINARFINGRGLSLRFGSDLEKQGLSFISDDLGATLRLLDVTDDIAGGRVAVTGEISDAVGRRVLRGHVVGENYNLVHAPGLT